ncbi:MAG TPA: hypothetical protein VGL33_15940 [Streptosporangiaceae bacterium]|jgi:hypothetical protein
MGDERSGAFGFFSGFPVGTRIASYRVEKQIGWAGWQWYSGPRTSGFTGR